MARYEVRCEVEVPDELNATEKQVEEWVRFNLNENGVLGPSPIQDRQFEALPFSVEVIPHSHRRVPVAQLPNSSDDPYGGL